MTQFTVPWPVRAQRPDYGFVGKAVGLGILLYVVGLVGYGVTHALLGDHPVALLLLVAGPLITAQVPFLAILVVRNWASVEKLLLRSALFILMGAVVGTGIGVWLVNALFAFVTGDLIAMANDPAVHTWFGGALTLGEIQTGLAWAPAWLCALIWPVQFSLVRDLTSLGALVGLFNIVPVYFIWWERKVAGRIQSRLGPMRVGGWHGWAQSPADGIKLLLKEDLVPEGADEPLFRVAPYFAIIPSLMAFIALPLGTTYIFRELDVALLFILAMLGVEVVGVIIAGWASNNKWSVYGAMREACQMVSYEIPMGMAILVPIVGVGSISLRVIGDVQSDGWFSWLAFTTPFNFLAFVTYYVASLASCKRAPFDLPEAESELVAGFHTEYSGFRWSLFFFAEYAAMFVVAALASILFLGAWNSPIPLGWGDGFGDSLAAQGVRGLLMSGPVWLVLKCVFLVYVQIWLRWTLPRIRIDQVLYACVQVLLPFTMILLMGAAIWAWLMPDAGSGWQLFSSGFNVLLGLIGAGFCFGFVAIAAYGFYHRRKLVGNLVIDVLPGS